MSFQQSEGARWFCVRTKRFSEHIAKEAIVAQVGVETFCPFLRFEKPRRSGKLWVTEALFPNYIFVFTDDYGAHYRHILSIRGVLKFVEFGGIPAVVPAHNIAEIRAALGENDIVTIRREISPGDEVTVVEGPLQGVEAVVTRVMPAKERVAVLLDMLGQPQEIILPASRVISRDVTVPFTTI